MTTDKRTLASLCGSFGIAAVVSYFFGALVELPIPDGLMLLIFFGFPAFGIAHWYLLRTIVSAEGRNILADLALIFATAGFTLLMAMVMAQVAVRLGIADLQAQAAGEAQVDDLKVILTSVRYVDLGIDVAWDFFIGTAFILTGIAVRRVPGLGLAWGLPLSVLGAALILLNAWTFPWPPDTQGLFDIGPFCALYMLIFSTRILLLGRREKA